MAQDGVLAEHMDERFQSVWVGQGHPCRDGWPLGALETGRGTQQGVAVPDHPIAFRQSAVHLARLDQAMAVHHFFHELDRCGTSPDLIAKLGQPVCGGANVSSVTSVAKSHER